MPEVGPETLELGLAPSFTPAFPGASGSEALEVGTASMSARRESSDSELVLCFFLARAAIWEAAAAFRFTADLGAIAISHAFFLTLKFLCRARAEVNKNVRDIIEYDVRDG